jgi:hypothetical protein
MPLVGFEPTIPVFKRVKAVYASDCAVTVIDLSYLLVDQNFCIHMNTECPSSKSLVSNTRESCKNHHHQTNSRHSFTDPQTRRFFSRGSLSYIPASLFPNWHFFTRRLILFERTRKCMKHYAMELKSSVFCIRSPTALYKVVFGVRDWTNRNEVTETAAFYEGESVNRSEMEVNICNEHNCFSR